MGRHSFQMLHDVLDSFVRQVMTYMMEDSRTIPSVLTALFCARSIERIDDSCQNICEFIFYFVKRQDFRHIGGAALEKLLCTGSQGEKKSNSPPGTIFGFIPAIFKVAGVLAALVHPNHLLE